MNVPIAAFLYGHLFTLAQVLSESALTIQIAAFLLGGLLLLIGVIGGGFEVKELKVPRVGAAVRVLSALVGVVFIVVGLGTSSPNTDNAAPKVNPPPVDHPVNEAVDFVITDHLGEGEVSDQVTILIDGKEAGTLQTTSDYPNSRITATVPKPGQHSYALEGSQVQTVQGSASQFNCAGQGMIDVEPQKHYAITSSFTGSTCILNLMEVQ